MSLRLCVCTLSLLSFFFAGRTEELMGKVLAR